MSASYNRREMLLRSSAWAGLATTATAQRLVAGNMAPQPTPPSLPVAVGRCTTYDTQRLTSKLQEAIDLIGGVKELVANKTVTIKLNLTGGPFRELGGLPAYRTYHVHPDFVAATCAILHRANAKRIVLVESGYDRRSLDEVMAKGQWDLKRINSAGGGKVTWEDTRHRGSWKNYSRLQVPWGGYVYSAFDVNSRYEKTDVLISLAKLKDHANAGVTLGVKNMFGIAPSSLYGDNYDGSGSPTIDETSIKPRGDTFHKGVRMPPAGAPQEVNADSSRHWSYRVPRVTADLFGIRPVDLCLIDGIETNRGGEGPWIRGVQPLKPNLLLVGRNGVCTDAIGAATMGYDPNADHKQFPFMGDNHLKLLAEKNVGTNIVEDIEVRGLSLQDAIFPFNPNKLTVGQPIFS
jgi:uncharacterized protein (DUF362 family)